MPSQSYELLPRTSAELHDDEYKEKPRPRRRWIPRLLSALLRKASRVCRPIYILPALLIFLFWQLVFNGSYTSGDRSWERGLEAGKDDTVFIAANIIDGKLLNGAWGRSVLELVERIGKDRVFVSIYGDPKEALADFAAKLECKNAVVSESVEGIDLGTVPKTTLPTGEQRIKRIAYLAEVRNKALAPLEKFGKEGKRFDKVLFINDVHFHAMEAVRLLWGTNVNAGGKAEYKAACGVDFITSWKMYDTYATRDAEGYSIGVPIFPWFANEGRAGSRNDLLAGRGEVGVKSCWGGIVAFDGRYFESPPPSTKSSTSILGGGWLTPSKHLDHPPRDESWNSSTELENRDDAKPPPLPLRFRAEPEPFWDASECCLIHADILALPPYPSSEVLDSDHVIFMNPYVRVAYDASTLSWIPFAKRFERLFSPLQRTLNYFAHMPRFNYRREEKEGTVYKDRVWVSNVKKAEVVLGASAGGLTRRATLTKGTKSKEQWVKEGHYEDIERVGTRGGYCGVRQLLVLKKKEDDGGGNWDNLMAMVPPLGM